MSQYIFAIYEPIELETYPPQKGWERMGYMNKVFDSREEAREYFTQHISNAILIDNVMRDEWDNETQLGYIIEPYTGQRLNITTFD